MASRGLPGFLRRSRRRDDFEDDVSTDTGGDDNDTVNNNNNKNETTAEGGVNVNRPNQDEGPPSPYGGTMLPTEEQSWSNRKDPTLDSSPILETVEREENVGAGPWNRQRNDGRNKHGDNHLTHRDSMSTLGDSDPVLDAASTNAATPSSNSATPARTDPPTTDASGGTENKRLTYRESQFARILADHVVKMTDLRTVGWNGIPPQFRGMTWKILLGYLPTNSMRRQQTLERKRAEYKEAIRQHYDIDDNSRTLQEQETLRQVLVDVPRTAPEIPLFRNERIKRALARLLYIWAMRHPASSYVQGINDLATPLFAVFLADFYEGEDVLDGSVMVVLTEERLDEVEADVYWCLTNILAGIQDHYTADQPGVQRMVMRLQELVNRIDGDLADHIQSVGIQFMQFAFKWMNCLLLREFNMKCIIRLWDTYISEEGGNGFEDFHVYVCAAFLCQFSSQLQGMDFDELFQFMQQVPTEDWGETEIEMLLSQAYVLSTLFGGSDAHLMSSNRVPPAAVM